MNIGDMKTKVTFQEYAESSGDYGDEKTWQDYEQAWGSLENLSGRAYFEAQQANSEVTGKLKIRYRDDIKPEMRIKVGTDRVLNIETFYDPDGRNRELHILVKEQTS